MPNLNKVILIGHICADPELKQTPSGISVTRFNLGVSRKYKNQDGTSTSDFISIVAWRQQAEFVAKYFKKGQAIGIVGSVQSRQYTDKDGNKRTAVEVVADEMFFVEMAAGKTAQAPAANDYAPSAQGGFEQLASDEDLPF